MTDTPQRDIWTISRLTAELRAVLQQSFPLLWVGGEISGLATPRSGHLYFNLKDSGSQIRCALFRNKRNLLRFQPKDGDQVLARARISCYEPRGEVQLIIEHLEPAGAGALQQAFEALKARLAAEGLFDNERKQALPAFPRRLGLVTSASGAALHDVLHVLARRFPALPVRIYPVPVQGAGAAVEIAETLRLADQRGDCDLLLLTRGGGSPEDLAQFNDEQLARTIAALKTPIVAAIGHEVDFTIAEFVADRRAPTPSAAAELVSPDSDTMKERVRMLARRLAKQQSHTVRQAVQRLADLSRRLQLQHPASRLLQRQQRLDEIASRLESATGQRLRQASQRSGMLRARLAARSPALALTARRERLAQVQNRLERGIRQSLKYRRDHLAGSGHQLHLVSPLNTLARGYAIVQADEANTVIRDSRQLRIGQTVRVRLADGRFTAAVQSSDATAEPPVPGD